MAAKNIAVRKKSREIIEFSLDDPDAPAEDRHVYRFTPHKVAGVMLPVLDAGSDDDRDDEDEDGSKLNMTQRTWEWLRQGLTDDDYSHMRARLEDDDDDLDVTDVAQAVKYLMGRVTGRPTGSRRG